MQRETVTSSRDSVIAWYHDLVREIQATVRGAVPALATVLVVSRGDDELLRLDSREAWHFPRHADGRYAGYHPADSETAIAHLEELREKGAQYIVFPASARWWLEYYEDFADHLDSHYSIVADDEPTCTIYALRPQFETRTVTEGIDTRPSLDDYIETLLPGGWVAILGGPDSDVGLSRRETVAFPPPGFDGDTASALQSLEEFASRGVEFLVVPHASPSWLDEYPGFLSELERRYRLVASQHHFCTVFELRPAPPEQGEMRRAGVVERLKSRWSGAR
jgi:hypothetical protein